MSSSDASDRFAAGREVRTRVMGAGFVHKARSEATGFTGPLQDFIDEHAWGSVWCRGGIDLKTRSLVTVAMLTALGRSHELAGHVRGALNNGATEAELLEVLLHAAVYCGVPLAADAFRTAERVLRANPEDGVGERTSEPNRA